MKGGQRVISQVIMLWPKSPVCVSTSCHILKEGPKLKQESIFNIFGIGSHTAVKTGRRSKVWRCVYCKHRLQKHPLSSAALKALRHCQWHFGVFIYLDLEKAVFCSQAYIPHMLKFILGSWDIFVSTQCFKCAVVCVSCVCSFAQIPNLKVMKISLGTSSVTAVAFHHALPQLWIWLIFLFISPDLHPSY